MRVCLSTDAARQPECGVAVPAQDGLLGHVISPGFKD